MLEVKLKRILPLGVGEAGMETWVVISVVVAAIAIVFQACMLTAMFLQMKRTMEKSGAPHRQSRNARRARF